MPVCLIDFGGALKKKDFISNKFAKICMSNNESSTQSFSVNSTQFIWIRQSNNVIQSILVSGQSFFRILQNFSNFLEILETLVVPVARIIIICVFKLYFFQQDAKNIMSESISSECIAIPKSKSTYSMLSVYS